MPKDKSFTSADVIRIICFNLSKKETDDLFIFYYFLIPAFFGSEIFNSVFEASSLWNKLPIVKRINLKNFMFWFGKVMILYQALALNMLIKDQEMNLAVFDCLDSYGLAK